MFYDDFGVFYNNYFHVNLNPQNLLVAEVSFFILKPFHNTINIKTYFSIIIFVVLLVSFFILFLICQVFVPIPVTFITVIFSFFPFIASAT